MPTQHEIFTMDFASTFCATWCANNWEQFCMEDRHDELKNPPVDEAIYLAEEVWNKYVEEMR